MDEKFRPSCGIHTDQPYCPADGTATVYRARLVTDATDLRAGDVIDGRYRVTGVLGRGGFGAVYAAEHTGTGQAVALKLLLGDPDRVDGGEVRRFHREARITAALRHAHTVRVFDVGRTAAGAPYQVMERLNGPTLERLLKDRAAQGAGLTEAETLDLGIAVLKSLSEAHGQGLVHRDLKPANLMLTNVDGEQVVKVLDFGIARPQESSLTGTGRTLGTPAYMSPEQCRGEALDGRSDLYALGIVLFRCLAGRTPFWADSSVALVYKQIAEAPPDLRAAARMPVSDGLADCVMRAFAKDPAERFATARDMRHALEAVQRGETPARTVRFGSEPVRGARATSATATDTEPASAPADRVPPTPDAMAERIDPQQDATDAPAVPGPAAPVVPALGAAAGDAAATVAPAGRRRAKSPSGRTYAVVGLAVAGAAAAALATFRPATSARVAPSVEASLAVLARPLPAPPPPVLSPVRPATCWPACACTWSACRACATVARTCWPWRPRWCRCRAMAGARGWTLTRRNGCSSNRGPTTCEN